MDIFKDYSTSDVLFDEPFKMGTIILYPIKVYDYKEFIKYVNYFLFSKKHYGLDNKVNLFEYTISVNVAKKTQTNKKSETNDKTEYLLEVLDELSRVFTIVCRENIHYDKEKIYEGEIIFTNDSKTIMITKNNYELVRQIVLKQNMIAEPKIFEDEIEAKLAEKYLKAQKTNKNSISGLGEIANLISCVTGKTYGELYNQNLMQLYADFYRCINTESFKATTLFRTVDSKVDVVNFTQEITSILFKDPYEGMWKDRQQIFG